MLAIGSVVGIGVSRHNATWVNRRNTAAEAFGSAVAVHSAVLSSLRLARQVEAELGASRATSRASRAAPPPPK